MEVLIGFFALALVLLAVVGPVLALLAFSRTSTLRARVEELTAQVTALDVRVAALVKTGRAAPAEVAIAAPVPPEPPVPRVEAAPEPVQAPEPVGPIPMVPPPTIAPPPGPASPPPPSRPDFATNLGPKILVGAGALAFVVFLGLFVKYAWESNWVGPAGRVLLGAAMGLVLVIAGVRILGREYRPLGQGLAGAGLAGLYVSAFGAHGFYGLISREAAGLLMVAITANAVLLAMKLDARLLATLAWVGGYLTPFLLSTGEDKAVALFAYLALLDAGALVLDHRKPWKETVPLAMIGTLVLYLGWYEQFFRPERFEVAAGGLVLFTALFALGMARKERGAGLGVVFSLAAMGVSALAAGADRPLELLVLAFGLAGAALRLAPRMRWLSLIAGAALALPYLAWTGSHYRPEAFGIAAAWVTAGALLLVAASATGRAPVRLPLEPLALLAGGIASIALGGSTDKPASMLLFLLALAAVAVLARRRWAWSEVVGVVTAALAVHAWFDRFYKADRASEALALALTVAGAYLLALVVRGFVMRQAIGVPGVVGHLVAAGLAWTALDRVLEAAHPHVLGAASLSLAVLYLAIGLVALRERREDLVQVRVTLGLAAAFLTLAIPVQLGLHGITLAWALEGLLLLVLGVRFGSALARVGGYGVLALAVVRLFARHLPLHPAHQPAFQPFLNPSFGTWLAVAVTLALAVRMARKVRADSRSLDHALRVLTGMASVILLFGLLTAETQATFAQRATLALAAGDAAAAEAAGLAGALAVSVLWTAFATGLLAAGLGLRSRALFYSGYALFAVTSAKVVMWDLATFETLYRMLSFLALGALLMAGAYLNLRFRQRLMPGTAAP